MLTNRRVFYKVKMLCLQTKRFSNRLKEMWDNTQFKGIFTKLDYQFELYKRLRCAQVMFAIGVEDPIRTVLCTKWKSPGNTCILGCDHKTPSNTLANFWEGFTASELISIDGSTESIFRPTTKVQL